MIFSALLINFLLSTFSMIVLGICEWIMHVLLSLKSEECNGEKIILLGDSRGNKNNNKQSNIASTKEIKLGL